MRSKKAITFILTAVLIISLFSFSSSSFATNQKISIKLAGKLKGNPSSKIPVIVLTKEGFKANHEKRVRESNGKIKQNLSIIKGFSADLPAVAIADIAECDDVTRIIYDNEVHACLDTATSTINAPSAWASGYTGDGVNIAVLDTGIYPHPDLTQPTNRITVFKDFINGRSSAYDDNGHGTHVSGIIAGNGFMSNGLYKGLAPQANLIGVKVLDSNGSGRTSDIVAGIQWVVKNKKSYTIKILNLSLGSQATESYVSDPLSLASEAAWNAGIVVIAAAGNNGPVSGSILTPGFNPEIITVGAADDKGTIDLQDDVIANFSSRGPTFDGFTKPDVLAPGVSITSLSTDKSYLPTKNGSIKTKGSTLLPTMGQSAQSVVPAYITMSGTSMATPMVSGLSALLLEQNPTWSPLNVKQRLQGTAFDLGLTPDDQGYGYVEY